MIRIRHNAFAFISEFQASFIFPLIELKVKEIPVVVFVAKVSISQDSTEKALVSHHSVLNIFQVLRDKRTRFWVGQIMCKFFAYDKPLTGRIEISTVCLLLDWGEAVNPMKPVIAFHEIVPNAVSRAIWFHNYV